MSDTPSEEPSQDQRARELKQESRLLKLEAKKIRKEVKEKKKLTPKQKEARAKSRKERKEKKEQREHEAWLHTLKATSEVLKGLPWEFILMSALFTFLQWRAWGKGKYPTTTDIILGMAYAYTIPPALRGSTPANAYALAILLELGIGQPEILNLIMDIPASYDRATDNMHNIVNFMDTDTVNIFKEEALLNGADRVERYMGDWRAIKDGPGPGQYEWIVSYKGHWKPCYNVGGTFDWTTQTCVNISQPEQPEV